MVQDCQTNQGEDGGKNFDDGEKDQTITNDSLHYPNVENFNMYLVGGYKRESSRTIICELLFNLVDNGRISTTTTSHIIH